MPPAKAKEIVQIGCVAARWIGEHVVERLQRVRGSREAGGVEVSHVRRGGTAELKRVVHCVAADDVALMHAEIMFAIRLSLLVSGVTVRVTAGLMLLL